MRHARPHFAPQEDPWQPCGSPFDQGGKAEMARSIEDQGKRKKLQILEEKVPETRTQNRTPSKSWSGEVLCKIGTPSVSIRSKTNSGTIWIAFFSPLVTARGCATFICSEDVGSEGPKELEDHERYGNGSSRLLMSYNTTGLLGEIALLPELPLHDPNFSLLQLHMSNGSRHTNDLQSFPS